MAFIKILKNILKKKPQLTIQKLSQMLIKEVQCL